MSELAGHLGAHVKKQRCFLRAFLVQLGGWRNASTTAKLA
jgi:hypothetical protein